MGRTTDVIRIGAATVAVGIGAAMASPAVAAADDDAASTKASSSQADSPSESASSEAESQAAETDSEAPDTDADVSDVEDDDESDDSDAYDTEAPESAADEEQIESDLDVDAGEADDLAARDGSRDTETVETVAASGVKAPTTKADVRPARRSAEAVETLTLASGSEPMQASDAAAVAADDSDESLPDVWVVVTDDPPNPLSELRPLRSLALGILGIFGFDPDPEPSDTNNPFLEAIWGLYRRIESFVANEDPDIAAPTIVDKGYTDDGDLYVTFKIEVTDYDNDPVTVSIDDGGTHGDLIANRDGTYTYLADNDFRGTDFIQITAHDHGFHLANVRVGDWRPFQQPRTSMMFAIRVSNEDGVHGSIVTREDGNSWRIRLGAGWSDKPEARSSNPNVLIDAGRSDSGTISITINDTSDAAGEQITVTVFGLLSNGRYHTEELEVGTVNNLTLPADFDRVMNQIPSLPFGVTYTQVASLNSGNLLLLRSDGRIIYQSLSRQRSRTVEANFAELPEGLTYTQIAATADQYFALRSDGIVVASGPADSRPDLPTLAAGTVYTKLVASDSQAVLLRSDGTAVVLAGTRALTVPQLPAGIRYVDAAAAGPHSALLRSDGAVVFVDTPGRLTMRKPEIPSPPAGLTYTGIATRDGVTALMRSDGVVVHVTRRQGAQIFEPLEEAYDYTQIWGSGSGILALRSDGVAVELESNQLYRPDTGTRFTAAFAASGIGTFLHSVRGA